jgi:hypothetical protein
VGAPRLVPSIAPADPADEGGPATGGAAPEDSPGSEGSSGASGEAGINSEASSTAGAGASSEAGESHSEGGTGESSASNEKATTEGDAATSEATTEAKPPVPFRFFASTSFWNTPVTGRESLDPSSTAVVAALDNEVAEEEQLRTGPWINTAAYSVPIYEVPADQPTVTVELDSSPIIAPLQAAWEAVPLPPTAQPAAGTDKHLVVWQPSTDRLWEFWKLTHDSAGWHAAWGGAMQDTSASSGAYGPASWPGAKAQWGASASSLSIAGGLITLEDLALGEINHALAISVPNVRAGVYASPAERSDGKSTSVTSLPEGARLRLNPSLDLASLHLPRLTLMIAEAAQRYGIIVRDRGAEVSLYAQDPTPTGTQPYAGTQGYFGGKYPNELLASFPWDQLQLVHMELHTDT